MKSFLCNLLILLVFFPGLATAKVIDWKVERRFALPDEIPTGDAGRYERLEGVVTFGLDPANPANNKITDLKFAPQNPDGLVEAQANFVILQPIDPETRSGIAWLEVSNRGGMASLRYFQQGNRDGVSHKPETYGDGLIMGEGVTLIWVGWQADVVKSDNSMWLDAPIAKNPDGSPITGLVRSDWVVDEAQTSLKLSHRNLDVIYHAVDFDHAAHQLTRRAGRNATREVVSRDQWRFNDTGDHIEGDFTPGYIYELVYLSQDPRVIGMGLASIRDFMSHLKYDADAPVSADEGIAFGVSQTGRFLRHFLYQGFNVDEAGRKVFDGMLIHTAGAGRGSFNHRFAQPSRDAHRFSAFVYPTDIFPFSTHPQPDPSAGKMQGLLDALPKPMQPKIMFTNTSYEYWGRAAALIHSSWQDGSDLPLLENERVYHLASAQHYVGRMPDKLDGSEVSNPLDLLVTLRALSMALIKWVGEGIEPPHSAYPSQTNGGLVAHDRMAYPAWVKLRPRSPHTAYSADYGPRWSKGIIDYQPPKLGQQITPLVPQLDDAGNARQGLRALALHTPLMSYLPWALRGGASNADEMVDFQGHVYSLPKARILALYKNKDAFMAANEHAADLLIKERSMLAEDRERTLAAQSALWDRIINDQAGVQQK